MDTMGERLRKARTDAGYGSAMSAAKHYGWPPSSYAAHENGQNNFNDEHARKYGRAFKVSAGWLLAGDVPQQNRNIARVMGRIGAGAEITPDEEQVPPDGLHEIEAPFPLPDDAIAFEVEGTSMQPRYDPGDVVICQTRERDPRDLVGQEVAIKTTKGQRFLKRIVRGTTRTGYDLESVNAKPMRAVSIEWASAVHSVIRAGQWQRLDRSTKTKAVRRPAR